MEKEPHIPNWTHEENWKVLKSCIVLGAVRKLGRGKRRQLEWFEENAEKLLPLIEKTMRHTKEC